MQLKKVPIINLSNRCNLQYFQRYTWVQEGQFFKWFKK